MRIKITNVDSVLKSKDITLLTKVCIVKAMVFPVVIYGCEIWTVKKAEHQRTDAFKLRCWRRLLWVPWTVRRSNQSILKEINPEHSLEGLMLTLKLQYCGHLERVTGRKAGGLQKEEIACKCQIFFSLLSSRRKQTNNIFPSLYKFKRRFLLKYCVAIMTPGFTWS